MTATVPTSDEFASLAALTNQLASDLSIVKSGQAALTARVTALEADGPLPPPVTPPPVVTPPVPPTGTVVTVTSLASLKSALADSANDIILVRDNTYGITGDFEITSPRTRPVIVRPETAGWAIDGGARSLRPLWFHAGASKMRLEKLTIQNAKPVQAGAIVYGNDSPDSVASDITVTGKIARSIIGDGAGHEHAVYWTGSTPTRCNVEDMVIELSTGMEAGLHFYHNPNARDCAARRVSIDGAQQPVMLWSDLTPLLLEDITVTNARKNALRYEYGSGITLRRYKAVGPGATNFEHSSSGSTKLPALYTAGTFIDGGGNALT